MTWNFPVVFFYFDGTKSDTFAANVNDKGGG